MNAYWRWWAGAVALGAIGEGTFPAIATFVGILLGVRLYDALSSRDWHRGLISRDGA